MEQHSSRTRTVTVDLPVDALYQQPWDPHTVAEELRLLWIIEQVRQGFISSGRGAELAAVPKARFLRVLGAHGVPSVHVEPEDFDAEFGAASPDED